MKISTSHVVSPFQREILISPEPGNKKAAKASLAIVCESDYLESKISSQQRERNRDGKLKQSLNLIYQALSSLGKSK